MPHRGERHAELQPSALLVIPITGSSGTPRVSNMGREPPVASWRSFAVISLLAPPRYLGWQWRSFRGVLSISAAASSVAGPPSDDPDRHDTDDHERGQRIANVTHRQLDDPPTASTASATTPATTLMLRSTRSLARVCT